MPMSCKKYVIWQINRSLRRRPVERDRLIAYVKQLPFREATGPLHFVVTDEDRINGKRKSFLSCPIALAIKRALNAQFCIVSKHRCYVDHVDERGYTVLWRYILSEEAEQELADFDRTGRAFRARKLDLQAPSPLSARSLKYPRDRRRAHKKVDELKARGVKAHAVNIPGLGWTTMPGDPDLKTKYTRHKKSKKLYGRSKIYDLSVRDGSTSAPPEPA